MDFLEDHKNPLVFGAPIGDSQLKMRILGIPIRIHNLLVLISQLKNIMRIGPNRVQISNHGLIVAFGDVECVELENLFDDGGFGGLGKTCLDGGDIVCL